MFFLNSLMSWGKISQSSTGSLLLSLLLPWLGTFFIFLFADSSAEINNHEIFVKSLFNKIMMTYLMKLSDVVLKLRLVRMTRNETTLTDYLCYCFRWGYTIRPEEPCYELKLRGKISWNQLVGKFLREIIAYYVYLVVGALSLTIRVTLNQRLR